MSIAIKDRVDNPPFYSHNINMPNIVSPRPGQVIEGGTVELMVGMPSYFKYLQAGKSYSRTTYSNRRISRKQS